MNPIRECLNCKHLGACSDTDATKVIQHFVCTRWDAAQVEIISARERAIQLFGTQGAKAMVSSDLKQEEDD